MPPIPSHKIDLHIGQRIIVRRKLLGMDEKELAEAADISLYRLRRYESAQSTIPASTLNDIAQKLGVPFGYFFVRQDRTNMPKSPGQIPMATIIDLK